MTSANECSHHPGGLRLTERAARLAGISDGMKVADIGCGYGATLRRLSSIYDISAAGLDKSGERIEYCRDASPGIVFFCCGAERPPFDEESLDAVFMECVLSETIDPEKALREAYQALAPGGRLIISDIYAKTASAPPWTKDMLSALITGAGLSVITEEDHTPALVTYAAQRDGISSGGLGCGSGGLGRGTGGFGYVLIVAKRDTAPRYNSVSAHQGLRGMVFCCREISNYMKG